MVSRKKENGALGDEQSNVLQRGDTDKLSSAEIEYCDTRWLNRQVLTQLTLTDCLQTACQLTVNKMRFSIATSNTVCSKAHV